MSKFFDFNCMVGSWPFHRVRNSSFADLKALHARVGISGGIVSSTEAIFWNDPYEADRLLAQTLSNDENYKQVMTVNPTLVAWRDDLTRAEGEIHPVGVRVAPGFHGYSLDHPEMQALAEECEKRGLILVITMHMEDERVAYLLPYTPVPTDEVSAFLKKNPNLKVLLANIRMGEAKALAADISANPQVYLDISGFKDGLFVVNDIIQTAPELEGRLVYGSMSPIFCITSTTMFLSHDNVPVATADKIRQGNGFANGIF